MATSIQPYIWFMYKFIIVVQFNDYLFISYPGGTTTCCGSSLAFSKYYAYTFYRRCSHGCKLLGCNGQFTNATAWIFSATFKYAGVLELIKKSLHWTFWTAEGSTKCKEWSTNWRWYWERVRPQRRQVCSLRNLRKFGPIALKPTEQNIPSVTSPSPECSKTWGMVIWYLARFLGFITKYLFLNISKSSHVFGACSLRMQK